MTPYDTAGLIGVALVSGVYIALQTGRLTPEQPVFSALNAAGAALVLFSLIFEFNLSAAIVEGFWLLASLFGLARSLRRAEPGPEA